MKLLIVVIFNIISLSSATGYSMTCNQLLNNHITPHILGSEWRTAGWRDGLEPFRYYNFKALERVIEDPDLSALAQRWMNFSQMAEVSQAKFMDMTYQYLVFLADVRIKFDVPIGGNPDQPKPLLNILATLLDAREANLDTANAIETISVFIERFVHPELGVNQREQAEMGAYINQELNQSILNLRVALSLI